MSQRPALQPDAINLFLRRALFHKNMARSFMISTLEKAFSVGKYLVSPLIRTTDSGHYQAGVSIRNGQGSGTHDRVFRFVPEFMTRESAARYAIAESHRWLRQQHVCAT